MAEGKKRALPAHFAAEKPRPAPPPVNRELLPFVPSKSDKDKSKGYIGRYKGYIGRYYKNGAGRLTRWAGTTGKPVCVACWDDEDCAKPKEARYEDEWRIMKFCAPHARAAGTYRPQRPCELCPKGNQLEAHYPNLVGKDNKLCANHAREAGSYEVTNPCRDCPKDAKLQAGFKDEQGAQNKLCSTHALEAGSYEVRYPCRDCPEDAKLDAGFKDEAGRVKKLCATHARDAGTFVVLYPCRDCPEGEKREANYKDEQGQCRALCGTHARLAGVFVVLHPCRDCPEGDKLQANYKDEAGRCKKLCAEHAFRAGVKAKFCPGASVMACDCWDRLKSYSGVEIPHIHFAAFSSAPPTGSEVKGLIPGRNLRPDGFIAANQPIHTKGEDSGPKGAVYLFHGEQWHGGWPADHPNAAPGAVNCQGTPFETLYKLTLQTHELYKACGYRVFVVWGEEYKKVRIRHCPVHIKDVVREV